MKTAIFVMLLAIALMAGMGLALAQDEVIITGLPVVILLGYGGVLHVLVCQQDGLGFARCSRCVI